MDQFHEIFFGYFSFSGSKILIFMEKIQFFFVKLIYLITQDFYWPGLFKIFWSAV